MKLIAHNSKIINKMESNLLIVLKYAMFFEFYVPSDDKRNKVTVMILRAIPFVFGLSTAPLVVRMFSSKYSVILSFKFLADSLLQRQI